MEFQFYGDSRKHFYWAFGLSQMGLEPLKFVIQTYEDFHIQENIVELLDGIHDFVDKSLRTPGQNVQLISDNLDSFSATLFINSTKFSKTLNNPLKMIRTSIVELMGGGYDHYVRVFLWNGYDLKIANEIESFTLTFKITTFLVINTFTKMVYDKEFYKPFFRLHEFK